MDQRAPPDERHKDRVGAWPCCLEQQPLQQQQQCPFQVVLTRSSYQVSRLRCSLLPGHRLDIRLVCTFNAQQHALLWFEELCCLKFARPRAIPIDNGNERKRAKDSADMVYLRVVVHPHDVYSPGDAPLRKVQFQAKQEVSSLVHCSVPVGQAASSRCI